jgi:hypothetical protein
MFDLAWVACSQQATLRLQGVNACLACSQQATLRLQGVNACFGRIM